MTEGDLINEIERLLLSAGWHSQDNIRESTFVSKGRTIRPDLVLCRGGYPLTIMEVGHTGISPGAKVDQLRIEQDRLDLPQTLPGDAHIAFARKSLAGFTRFLEHSSQSVSIKVPLIERDPAFLNDAGDNAGFRRAGADRANASIATFGDAINFRTHFRGRQESVPAAIHGCTARMRGLAAKSDCVPLNTERAENSTEWQAKIKQDRPLFDVEFEVSGRIF